MLPLYFGNSTNFDELKQTYKNQKTNRLIYTRNFDIAYFKLFIFHQKVNSGPTKLTKII